MRTGPKTWLIGLLLAAAAFTEPLAIYTELNAPFQFEAPDGSLAGLGADVVREIQHRVGNRDPILVVPWARGYLELQRRPNVVLFTMARIKERNDLFQWVGPIEETVFSLFVRADSAVRLRTLDDARKFGRIGVYRNDARDLFLTEAGFANLERTINNTANVKKLMAGRIDAFASTAAAIPELARSAGCRTEDLREALPFARTQGFIAFSKATSNSIVDAWSEALEAMKKDGTFERIHRKYFPKAPLPGPAITSF